MAVIWNTVGALAVAVLVGLHLRGDLTGLWFAVAVWLALVSYSKGWEAKRQPDADGTRSGEPRAE